MFFKISETLLDGKDILLIELCFMLKWYLIGLFIMFKDFIYQGHIFSGKVNVFYVNVAFKYKAVVFHPDSLNKMRRELEWIKPKH